MTILAIGHIIYTWRLAFIAVFCVIFVVLVIYTFHKTHKAFMQHDEREKEVREAAKKNIRMKELMNMVLRNSKAFFWEQLDGKFIYSESFRQHANMEDYDIDNVESMLHTNDFFRQKLQELFTVTTPGRYDLQAYGSIMNEEPHWYMTTIVVKDTPDGVLRQGLTYVIDDIKKREAMVLETHRLMANAKESEDFITCINHEIRTPLNAIVGISQILTTPGFQLSDEEEKMFADEIEKSNVLLMKMIEDMLTVTLMDNSNAAIHMTDINISEAMTEKLLLQPNGDVNIRHAIVKVEGGPEDATVKADKTLLARVMQNLLSNAAKFSPEGSTIHISWTTSPHHSVIYVRDEGKGITEEQRELVFQRFYKTDPFVQGTGLGLALCRMIMNRMQGTIGVDSKPYQGSTFWLRLKK